MIERRRYGGPETTRGHHAVRWAYTLYDSTDHPVLHALDTVRLTAVSIDLDDLPRAWGSSFELRGWEVRVGPLVGARLGGLRRIGL